MNDASTVDAHLFILFAFKRSHTRFGSMNVHRIVVSVLRPPAESVVKSTDVIKASSRHFLEVDIQNVLVFSVGEDLGTVQGNDVRCNGLD